MTAVVTASSRRDPLPDTPSDRLRRLARQVERLAVSGRTDPEEIAITKQLIARDLRRLAVEIGRFQ